MIKDKDEVAAIRRAVWQAEKAFGVLRATVRPEHTEKELADELEHQFRLFGGKDCSFRIDCGGRPAGRIAPCDPDRQARWRRGTASGRLGGQRGTLHERLDAGTGHR